MRYGCRLRQADDQRDCTARAGTTADGPSPMTLGGVQRGHK